ncbi:MAG: hypothetical protein ACE14P_11265 [Methanotrichaceae archaeon]
MKVNISLGKIMFMLIIVQLLSISIVFCSSLHKANSDPIENETSIPDILSAENKSDSNNMSNTSMEGEAYPGDDMYPVVIQGRVLSIDESMNYSIYIDNVLIGNNLEGLDGFRLVPGATVKTTPADNPYISVGDCVEVQGDWIPSESPPIYLLDINKTACSNANNPPSIPFSLSGPNSGIKKHLYRYSTSAIDPDKDQLRYYISWGDGTTSVSKLVKSGRGIIMSHKWPNGGIYDIKARAMDRKGALSEWSDPVTITIA